MLRIIRKHISAIISALIFLIGLALICYPRFANWWNQRNQSVAIASYVESVEDNTEEQNAEMLAAAEQYNETLRRERASGEMLMGNLTDEQVEEYNSLLDITGTGIMGYVKIPKIDVELPIYHGTDEAILQIAVGHIEGTSLPVGGTGTHTVISGHRGLPSAKLFTDIDNLGIGDVFMITVLDRKVTYEVDQILTVLPDELDSLEIDPDMDYCTLVTCTPYGINSHRLLVRGHRIANLVDEDVETIEVEIPERELSTQERIQGFLPYVMILAAGFFGLALILPSRRVQREEMEERDRRHAERDRKRRERYSRYGMDWDEEDDGYGDAGSDPYDGYAADDAGDPYDGYAEDDADPYDRYDDRSRSDPADRYGARYGYDPADRYADRGPNEAVDQSGHRRNAHRDDPPRRTNRRSETRRTARRDDEERSRRWNEAYEARRQRSGQGERGRAGRTGFDVENEYEGFYDDDGFLD